MITSSERKARREARARAPGRKASGPREPSGRKQREPASETEKQVLSVVLSQPHRRGIKVRNNMPDGPRGPRDERAAYAFGRMRLAGDLTKNQHDALTHWLEAYVRFSRSLNLPQVHYGSCLAISVGNSHVGDEPDPRAAASRAIKARRTFEELEGAMREGLGADLTEANVALVHVCLMDREPTRGMTGVLRLAANVIDRHRTATGQSTVD